MGGVFIEFSGGAGAWTQKRHGGLRYHFRGQAIPLCYCAWEKLYLPILLMVVGKVIPDVKGRHDYEYANMLFNSDYHLRV